MPPEVVLGQLREGLDFARSLGLAPGRFATYLRRLEHIVAGTAHARTAALPKERRAKDVNENRIAVTEGMEFGYLVPFLKRWDAALVAAKLKQVLKGPARPSDEDEESNKARNIQFELWLASMLAEAGIHVWPGDRPDATCVVGRTRFLVECKRIFSAKRLEHNVKEAAAQLRKSLSHVGPHDRAFTKGIVAVSLARVLNPGRAPLDWQGATAMEDSLANWLEQEVAGINGLADQLFSGGVAAAIVFETASDFFDDSARQFNRARFALIWTYRRQFDPDLDRLVTALEDNQTPFGPEATEGLAMNEQSDWRRLLERSIIELELLNELDPSQPRAALGVMKARLESALAEFRAGYSLGAATAIAEIAPALLRKATEVYARPSREFQQLHEELMGALAEVRAHAQERVSG